jgi:hypothetical protein
MDDYPEGCPQCGRSYGPLNVGPVHWFYCADHGVRWSPGYNLFPGWREESPEDWRTNLKLLARHRVVRERADTSGVLDRLAGAVQWDDDWEPRYGDPVYNVAHCIRAHVGAELERAYEAMRWDYEPLRAAITELGIDFGEDSWPLIEAAALLAASELRRDLRALCIATPGEFVLLDLLDEAV